MRRRLRLVIRRRWIIVSSVDGPIAKSVREVDILHRGDLEEPGGDHGCPYWSGKALKATRDSLGVAATRLSRQCRSWKTPGKAILRSKWRLQRPWRVVITGNDKRPDLTVDDNLYLCRLQESATLAAWFINWIESFVNIERYDEDDATSIYCERRPTCTSYLTNTERTVLLKYLKIWLSTCLKIISLDHQNNCSIMR